MRVTARDRRVLLKLAAARWLTTRQVAALCFPGLSLEMARRRLRLLARARYARSVRANAMAEALHTLAANGRSLIGAQAWDPALRLEAVPPKNLEHFVGINDIRVAAERSAADGGPRIEFFFASWELQRQGWAQPVIPDAVAGFQGVGRAVVFEYDRGEESLVYMVRNKYRRYAHGLNGLPSPLVVTVAESAERLRRLEEYAGRELERGAFAFITRERLLAAGGLRGVLDGPLCRPL